MKNLIYLFALSLILAACGKTADMGATGDDTPILLGDSLPSHWIQNGTIWGDHVYDNERRLMEIRRFGNEDNFERGWYEGITEFTYEGDNLKSAMWAFDGNLSLNADYFYTNSVLDSIQIVDQSGDEKTSIVFQYDFSQPCSLKSYVKTERHRFAGTTIQIHQYDYADNQCNFTKSILENGDLISKKQYQFGVPNNFYTFRFSSNEPFVYPAFSFLKNRGLTRECDVEADGSLNNCNESVYELSADDFPIKETLTRGNGTVMEFEYFYE